MICPSCHHEGPKPLAVTPDTEPTQGDIYICPQCAKPAIMSVLGWKPLSESELAELSEDEQKDLDFAIRNIKAYHKSENS